MKKAFCLFIVLGVSLSMFAAQYPPEWVKYTFDGYICDIQSGVNEHNQPEAEFKNRLLDAARTNLARQIQVRVQDFAELYKSSVNNRASVSYYAGTRFSTDVDLKLVSTKTEYDARSNEGFAIAYIDKDAARNYYVNVLSLLSNKIANAAVLAENFTEAGFKAKAETELNAALVNFEAVDEPLFWLNIFGASQSELNKWQTKFHNEEQRIKQLLAELKYGTAICLQCSAELFGSPYPALQNEIKGILSADGCSFTDNPTDADWVITVSCTAREYANRDIGAISTFVAYVDAYIKIYKTRTSQCIYEDGVSAKGTHTLSYNEAARSAYRDIKQQISSILTNNLRQ